IILATIASSAIAGWPPEVAKEAGRLEKAGARVKDDDALPEGARLAVTFDKLDDKTAIGLKGLKHVGKLTVEDTSNMTDKSLAVIGTFAGLQELSLTKPGMTNTGISSLKGLKELRKLYLIDAAKVTDAGVGSLKSLDKLEELDMSGSGITNAAGSTFKEL